MNYWRLCFFAVTWIMGRQAWHMYPSCSVHWVMQAEMPHIYRVSLVSQVVFVSPAFSLSVLLLTGCQQALQWTRMAWFISLMALQSERWTRTASSPLFLAPTTWHRLAPWHVTTAWTSIRWPMHTSARHLPVTKSQHQPPCSSSSLSVCSFMTHHWHAALYNCIYITYAVEIICFHKW